jgi:hypothetical protein
LYTTGGLLLELQAVHKLQYASSKQTVNLRQKFE